jgi:hypothetical protein
VLTGTPLQIPLAQNINNKSGPVTDGTYAAFIALMFVGLLLSIFLCDADKVIRQDGSKVILMKNPSWKTEFKGLWETLYTDPWILLLFPMFFASNVFYTYQNNGVNATHFNTRTRSLNSLLYWLSQIIGAVIIGYCLDYSKIRRSVRAKISLVVLLTVTMVVWGGGYAWQAKQVTRQQAKEDGYVAVDWEDGGERFIGPMFLYFFYGFFDAVWQTMIYWYMGALSNSGRKAANLAGFYKVSSPALCRSLPGRDANGNTSQGIQSAGAACFWAMDNAEVSYDAIFYATWGLLIVSLIFAAPVVWTRIQDTVTLEEDLKFSDETVEDIIVGGAAAAALNKHEKHEA